MTPEPHSIIACNPHQLQRWMAELVYPGLPTFSVAWRLTDKKNADQVARWWADFCASMPCTGMRLIADRPISRWSNVGSTTPAILRWESSDLSVQQCIAQARMRPWQLNQEPGLRATLISRDEQKTLGDSVTEDHDASQILLIEVHPLIADERSFTVMMQKFLSEVMGKNLISEPDNAASTPSLVSPVPASAAAEHWRDYLAGAPAVIDLPWDGPRRSSTTPHVRTEVSLGSATQSALQRAGHTNLESVRWLLAAVAAVCARITGQDDVVLGCLHADVPAPCAPTGSIWPARLDLRDDPRGAELLAHASHALNHIALHRQVPLASIIEATAGSGRQEHPPLFQIIVGREPDLSSDVLGKPLVIDPLASTTYLAFLVTANNTLAVYANPELASSEFTQRLANQVVTACEALVTHSDLRLSAIPLQSPTDEAALRRSYGQLERFPDGPCLHEQVAQQAALRPDAIALSTADHHVTYAELDRRANRLARHLINLGVGPETLVGHCLRRNTDAVVAILAILKAGGAYVPLDPAHPADRLLATIDDAGTTVVVCESALANRFQTSSATLVSVDGDATRIAQHSDQPIPSRVASEHLAYVIYTSGSTGRPKGVPITHGQVARLFSATQQWFSFSTNDTWTLFHSLAFDFSVWELWGPLIHGGRLVLVDELVQRSPSEFHALIRRERVTVLNQTPAAFYQFANADEDTNEPNSLSALRLVIFGGEKLELSALSRWFDRHGDQSPHLVNMYGITETTVHVTYRPLSKADLSRTGISPIGVAIPDLSLYLLDSRLCPVPVGVIGELFVGGAGVGRGYLNRPELTSERFIPDPFRPGQRMYRSGDAARRLPDGEIDYVGRLDQQVKIRGYRIELGEIDAVLRRQDSVADCVITVYQASNNAADRSLIAYIVLRDARASHDSVIAALRQAAKAALPSHMVPAVFMVLDRLPLTVNGKLDRRALPEPTATSVGSGTAFVAPSTRSEHTIAKAWNRILGSDRIGIDDNFFDIGGNSLRLIQVQALLEQELARPIPVVDLFQYPTIRALGKHLGDADGNATALAQQATLERARRQQQAIASRRRPERPA